MNDCLNHLFIQVFKSATKNEENNLIIIDYWTSTNTSFMVCHYDLIVDLYKNVEIN